MKENRSEEVGRHMELTYGWDAASLAARSTWTLPGMPEWPGAQTKVIREECEGKELSSVMIRETRGWVDDVFWIASSEARESEMMRKGWGESDDGFKTVKGGL